MTAVERAVLLVYRDDGVAFGFDIDAPEVMVASERDVPPCYCWPGACGCVPPPFTHTFTLTARHYTVMRGTNPDQHPELEPEEAERFLR